MRLTLLDTPYVRARDVSSHMKGALTFLIKNPDVMLQRDKIRELENQRLFASTPTSKIYRAVVAAGKMNNFLFLDYSAVTGRGVSVPEILTSDDLCIDGKAINDYAVPALVQRCWINITPILSRPSKTNSYHDSLFFTDLGQLTHLVTRAALCQAYQDNNNWITIRQQLMLVELYSVIMAQVITNTYRLDPVERRLIMTLFAYYYAQMVGSQEAEGSDVPPLLMRCAFLGSGSDIMDIVEEIKPFKTDGFLTLDGLIKCIQKIGPSRMKKYSLQVLFRSVAGASLDSSTMIIAQYYPPYFLYQLMRVASGYKNPIISGIVKALGLKRKLDDMANDIADGSNLIGVLNR